LNKTFLSGDRNKFQNIGVKNFYPIFVQMRAEPNLFEFCRVQPKKDFIKNLDSITHATPNISYLFLFFKKIMAKEKALQ